MVGLALAYFYHQPLEYTMTLSTSHYHDLIDDLFNRIEQWIDSHELDLDANIHGNVLTISFPSRDQMVINRQEALLELWLASKLGGFHFRYDANQKAWLCGKSQQLFEQVFNDSCRYYQTDLPLFT